MPIIVGIDRHQITFTDLESQIAQENEVRFIDAFVDKLDLKQLGIQSLTQSEKKKAGRASYEDALFLKLYLYAYLNGPAQQPQIGERDSKKYRATMAA